MLGKTYDGQDCSAARTLELVGERWSLLIIRDALFAGMTRFSEFERSLGIAPNVLAARLAWFVEAGLMTVEPVSEDSELSEYRLTEKGTEVGPGVSAGWTRSDRLSTSTESAVALSARSSHALRVVKKYSRPTLSSSDAPRDARGRRLGDTDRFRSSLAVRGGRASQDLVMLISAPGLCLLLC